MYFWYGIKNSSLEVQTEKPLELTIPQDRLNTLVPPDANQQYMMAAPGGDVGGEATWQEEEQYAPPTNNGYVNPHDHLASTPWVQGDPLAEDPWSKYD